MRKIWGLLMLISFYNGFAQENFSARLENETTGLPMPSVHILNLTQVIGTITDQKGNFVIPAKANDTLYFSYLGYKPLKIAVTNDMIKFGNANFKMTELAFALEEIVVRPYQLTGYLDIDVRNAPINTARRYSISGLPNRGYEAGSRNPNSISKSIENLFNPADLLNNIFGKNQIQMRKLKKMREDDEIKNLLASKFDRQVLMQLLGLKRIDINDILRNCNYSDAFIKEANDLQILEGISKCYEEFRVLQL
ncbi:carboxypeptidase-like regulatory domain-containing protein [Flavobacteriaceae bacterium]|nr:carboxypeptidase-like regulatory domain-containing protein [Flavobacteriaceae bacterium]MDB2342320.1 carboxypeptidase-like regulatory domain-containing protein [Flavobacteriaceae bacterium]MDC1056377.1 carboxypeptidase-like regulatory domain-containing protein [Flavobacteriaceae bacterium]MDG1711838.1 carboxypeptidase-like regulatory domain-containing protein [Flavobacteriaceae bacterium]MDG2504124.1 carboxypeptidase-like regulatory domain-containing protein [Flavobacteriaceae bacterium]